MKQNKFGALLALAGATLASKIQLGLGQGISEHQGNGRLLKASSKMAQRMRTDPAYKQLSMLEAWDKYNKNMIRSAPLEIAEHNAEVVRKKQQRHAASVERWVTEAQASPMKLAKKRATKLMASGA